MTGVSAGRGGASTGIGFATAKRPGANLRRETIVVDFRPGTCYPFVRVAFEVPVDSIDAHRVCRSHGSEPPVDLFGRNRAPSAFLYARWDDGSVVMEWQAVHETPQT